MSRVDIQVLGPQTRPVHPAKEIAKQVAIVIAASLFVALCARVTVPLPFTPVPLTLQNFGVLIVGLLLGSRRGFAALALYLAEGAFGLPVFSMGAGVAYLLGPTGGFLVAYPVVAFVAGLDIRAEVEERFETRLTLFRLGRAVVRGCGTRALHRRTQLARRAYPLGFAGIQVWPLLVRICGSHQSADGRRGR